jgi:hypothetical protein
MKYHVSFQRLPKGAERPIDHPSASDFETDDKGHAMIPNVGDYVEIIAMGKPETPAFDGRVRSRLFRYFNAEICGVHIVVEVNDDDGGKGDRRALHAHHSIGRSR